ncbi:MAG: flagellar hook assembly protein FlgD [Burkholderiales bacterium]|nr:flagellar hook assembly protein FlgD [Burkholderiales bacterium]
MAAVQDLTTTRNLAVSAASQQKSAASATGETENRFLRLLVTQLKNQDPLNPLDNAQVTTQMAQLSTVNGIEKLNVTLQSLAASFAAAQSMQATSMIGRGVLIPGSAIALEAGKAFAGVELAQPADKVIVSIHDASGNVLQQVDIGPQAAGVAAFQWDGVTNGGTAADGVYKFSVSATSAGKKVDASPLSFGRVVAVTPGAQGAMLTIGEIGSVALSDIRQIVQ